jgi:hypothetical protein
VRELLRSRGCTDAVVDGGLDGLISDWAGVVDSLTEGYGLGLDDYLHDVDGRELIAAVVAGVPTALTPALRRRLNAADARAKAALEPHPRCLWGDRLAKSNGWSREDHWWYFMRPRSPGPDLAEELGLT